MFDVSQPQFWVSLSFVLLVALAYKKIAKLLVSFLDDHARKIKSELSAASRIRMEAEEILALYKRKQLEFAKEAENILTKARADADANNVRAQIELQATLDARLKNALEKIAQEEAAAIAEVRNHIIDITLSSARDVIAKQMNTATHNELIKLAISDIEHKIH